MQTTATSVSDLATEIARYLSLVDELREEGLEPHWLPERDLGGTPQGWQPDEVSSG
jgi:hypothetical protein